jgi:hypothetical protein
MSPRVLPNSPVRHEQVALIATGEEEPKLPSRFEDKVNPRWLRIHAAVAYSGISRSRLFRLIREGEIQSACLQERPGTKRGVRLIDRLSLDLLLERLCQPVEQRLAEEAQVLDEQQNLLAKKQHEIEQQLSAIRRRKRGGHFD